MSDLKVRVTHLPGTTKVVVNGWNFYYGPDLPESEAKELAIAEYKKENEGWLAFVNR